MADVQANEAVTELVREVEPRLKHALVAAAAEVDTKPHDFRHTVATRFSLVDRWTPGGVQACLGHLDPRATWHVYAHINAAELPPTAMAIGT